MEIPEKLLRFKYHIIFSIILSLTLLTLLFVAPSFVTILAYFWPLLLSTALFLIAVLVFVRTSPIATDISGDKTGEGLLDYVAGKPDPEPESEPEPEPEHGHEQSFRSE